MAESIARSVLRRGARPPRAGPAAHRLYVHVAWTTLDRLPLLGRRRALAVEGHLIALCRRLDVEPMEVHVAADRVHVLLRLKPAHALGPVVRRLKSGTAEALVRAATPVRWSRGYAAATIAPGHVRRLMRRLSARHPGDRPPDPAATKAG